MKPHPDVLEASLMPARKLSALVVARGNGTEVFELVGETLDQAAIAMEEGAEGRAPLAVVPERPVGGTWIAGVGTDVNSNRRPNDRTQAMLANNPASRGLRTSSERLVGSQGGPTTLDAGRKDPGWIVQRRHSGRLRGNIGQPGGADHLGTER